MSELVRVGSLATDEIVGIKTLGATADGGNYSSFEQPIGSPYAPSGGKTFYFTKLSKSGDKEGIEINIGYGDDSVSDSAIPPTNPVYLLPATLVVVANQFCDIALFLEVPDGKYLFMQAIGGFGIVIVQGKEML